MFPALIMLIAGQTPAEAGAQSSGPKTGARVVLGLALLWLPLITALTPVDVKGATSPVVAAKLNCTLIRPTPTTLPRRNKETWEHEGLGIWARWERYVARAGVNLEDVFYVQVGANCGANVRRCAMGGDPIYEYATQCAGWRGVSIEPVLHTFGELQANYAAHPNVLTLRAAVAEQDGVGRVPRLSNLGKASEKVSLGRLGDNSHGGQADHRSSTGDDGNASKWEAVPVLSLQQLWSHLRPPKVDVLVVDVEGREPTSTG